MKICPRCKRKHGDEVATCDCGHNLYPSPDEMAESKRKKKRGSARRSILGGLLVFAIGAGAWFYSYKDAVATGDCSYEIWIGVTVIGAVILLEGIVTFIRNLWCS